MTPTSDAEEGPDRDFITHGNGLERRVSSKSSRPSTRSLCRPRAPSPKEHEPGQHPHHVSLRPPSPQRNNGHNRQVSTPLTLRRRMTSVHRSDVAQSPLAQIFQPLVLGDVPSLEETISDGVSGAAVSASLPQPQLSYGPATRRRSMQSMYKRQSETSLRATKPASVRPAFPPLDTRAETLTGLFSTSPDLQGEVRGSIATAEQVEESLEGNGGMSEWMKRIARMEERQERIEELLLQLHAQLQR